MLDLIINLILFFLTSLLIIWLFSRLDCDLQLLWSEKFGHSINDLKGKVVWITGASSGIGESLAYLLATAGVKLVLSGTNQQRLEQVKRQCILCGQLEESDVFIVRFDIKNFEEHQKHFNHVINHFKKLDILVNNAGRSQRANFHDIDIEVDKEMFDINVFGLINLTRIALRYFLENNIKGQFVVTSSIAGKIGLPNSATYTASKHALHGYFECLRTENQSKGIGVSMICPGPVFSRILENAFTGQKDQTALGIHGKHFNRMATSRCAHLMAIAMVNRIDEAWISMQPILSFYYMSQYFPTITRKLFPIFATPERIAKLREGRK